MLAAKLLGIFNESKPYPKACYFVFLNQYTFKESLCVFRSFVKYSLTDEYFVLLFFAVWGM